MENNTRVIAGVLLGLLLAPPAWAEDDELFAGLIPGAPVSDEELGGLYGKAGVEVLVTLADGSLLNLSDLAINNAPVDNSSSNTNTNVTGTSGIAQITPVTGDNNTVHNFVFIEIRMNTVEVNGLSGSSLTVNQQLDFGGVISAIGN